MNLFYFPGSYLYYSRLKGWVSTISLVLLYIVPISVICFTLGVQDLLGFLPGLLVSWFIFYAAYEIGYFQNDIFTVRREKRPNHRIAKKDQSFFQRNVNALILSRSLTAIIGLFFLAILLSLNQIIPFTLFLIMTLLLFVLHNTVRSRLNILTYFFLNVSKVLTLPALFLEFDQLLICLPFFIVIFSFLRTIEHAAKEKYHLVLLRRVRKNLDFSRILYFSTILGLFYYFHADSIWLYVCAYILIIRIIAWLLIRISSKEKLKLQR